MDSLGTFRENKNEIVAIWVQKVFSTYPLETTGFLHTKHDPFANPVGNMTREAGDVLFDAVSGQDISLSAVKSSLERFVRLRAVQSHPAGIAMAVFYLLKPILREKLMNKFIAAGRLNEYLEAESRLDSLVLIAFDIYSGARDALAESRIKEIRAQYAQLARWAQKLENGFNPKP